MPPLADTLAAGSLHRRSSALSGLLGTDTKLLGIADQTEIEFTAPMLN